MEELIKEMPVDDLWRYYSAAKISNRVVDIIGVSLIFMMLVFTQIFVIIPGVIVLYIISHMGAGIKKTITLIEDRIIDLPDK
jgi:hypothetical protein